MFLPHPLLAQKAGVRWIVGTDIEPVCQPVTTRLEAHAVNDLALPSPQPWLVRKQEFSATEWDILAVFGCPIDVVAQIPGITGRPSAAVLEILDRAHIMFDARR